MFKKYFGKKQLFSFVSCFYNFVQLKKPCFLYLKIVPLSKIFKLGNCLPALGDGDQQIHQVSMVHPIVLPEQQHIVSMVHPLVLPVQQHIVSMIHPIV